MAGEANVVGVDISGRHEEAGQYLMVGAAVSARIGSNRIDRIDGIGLQQSVAEPTLENALTLIRDALGDLPEPPRGPVVAEHGEFYGEPATTVSLGVDAEFKYVESIAERKTVEAAHHTAYAARNLLL